MRSESDFNLSDFVDCLGAKAARKAPMKLFFLNLLAHLCDLLGRVRRIYTQPKVAKSGAIYQISPGQLYLERFSLWGNVQDDSPGWWGINIWLHRIYLPDGDRAMHNHPWKWAYAKVLNGGYSEERPIDGDDAVLVFERSVGGSGYWLRGSDYHRICTVSNIKNPCWTLFITGKEHGNGWGFRVPVRGASYPDSTQVTYTHIPHEEYLKSRKEWELDA